MKKTVLFTALMLLLMAVCSAFAAADVFVVNDEGVLTKYTGTDTEVMIPETVRSIGDHVFSANGRLTSVTIPGSVESVGNGAFSGCKKLEKVLFEDGTAPLTIGENAFSRCMRLETIEIPQRAVLIGGNAFQGCNGLRNVYFRDDAAYLDIDPEAFPELEDTIVIRAFEKASSAVWADENGYTVQPYAEVITVRDDESIELMEYETVSSTALVRQFRAFPVPAGAPRNFIWTSSDESIAVTNPTGRVEFSRAGTVMITVTADEPHGRSFSFYAACTQAPAEKITIKSPDGNVINSRFLTTAGTELQFSAEAAPANALQSFSWESSDKNIAVVDPTGRVTFSRAGTVTVTASSEDGTGRSAYFYLTCQTVPAAEVIIRDMNNARVDSMALRTTAAELQFTAGAAPVNARQNVVWNSSDTETASVNSSGKVTFHKTGTVTITASAVDGTGLSAGFSLTCESVPASAVIVKDMNGTVVNNMGLSTTAAELQFTASAFPVNALQEIIWTVSDPGIASVDPAGKVTFRKAGTAAVIASAADGSGASAYFYLTCEPVPAAAVTVRDMNGTVINYKSLGTTGTELQFNAAAAPVNAPQNFVWKSSDTAIAEADPAGVVTFHKAGTVTITVSAADNPGVSAVFRLTCESVPPSAVIVRDMGGTVVNNLAVNTVSSACQFTAAAVPVNAPQEFTWTSSDTDIATVNPVGGVIFKKAGTVTITATGGGLPVSFDLTCLPVPAIAISIMTAQGNVVTGQTIRSTAVGHQFTAAAFPVNAAQNFIWKSSNTDIAEVDPGGAVTFRRAGEVIISVSAIDGSGLSASFRLICDPVPVSSITIMDGSGTMLNGMYFGTRDLTHQLYASVYPVNARQDLYWTSSDPEIAEVSNDGKVTFLQAGRVTITAAAADGSRKAASVHITCENVPAAGIAVRNAEGGIVSGSSFTTEQTVNRFTASAYPANARQNFIWTSSDPNIAAVTNSGEVTFRQEGTVSISVITTDNSWIGTYFNITCEGIPATGVTARNGNGKKINGKTIRTRSLENQFSASVVPSNASRRLTWTSSDPDIASVDAGGKVTFRKAGTVKITVRAGANSSAEASFSVICEEVPAIAVTITDPGGKKLSGESVSTKNLTYQVSASAYPANARQQFAWISSDTNIAAVDDKGNITFRKGGQVTITAAALDGSGAAASFEITSGDVSASSITIKDADGNKVNGKKLTTNKLVIKFSASASPANASQQFTWSSSKKGIARVNSSGKVTFKKAGTVKITVRAADGSDASASFEITCKNVSATAVTIKDADGNKVDGSSLTVKKLVHQFSASAEPANAGQEFTWTSSKPKTASVDASGKVTFRKAGTVTITAKAADEGGASASFEITCKNVSATAITIKDADGNKVTGTAVTTKKLENQFSASASPVNAKQTFTWTSSKPKVAKVDADGKVTFRRAGTVKITVQAGDGSGVSASFDITCANVAATGITVKDPDGNKINGKTFTTKNPVNQFTASASPANAKQQFSWTSSKPKIASVDADGKVTFKKAGTVKITVKAGDSSGKTASFEVTYKK